MTGKVVKVYEVHGEMKRSLDWQAFQKYVIAHNSMNAVENTFSLLGSKHRLKRYQIKVESVKEVTDPESVSDPLIRQYLEK